MAVPAALNTLSHAQETSDRVRRTNRPAQIT